MYSAISMNIFEKSNSSDNDNHCAIGVDSLPLFQLEYLFKRFPKVSGDFQGEEG